MSDKTQTASTRTAKRILSVTVKRIADNDGETAPMGEFSDTPNDYAIVHVGEHSGEFVSDVPCTCGHPDHSGNVDELCGANAETSTCDCDYYQADLPERGREFRYFNGPVDNYEGETAEDIRKYCQQDYSRMKGLLAGDWGYIGIKAYADLQTNGTIQTITSGGLWGIETDSEASYFTEIEKEELADLRRELEAIGFTKRAVSAAFRNVQHKDE